MDLKEIKIAATKETPAFELDPAGIIKIQGRSMNGYKSEPYRALERWIDRYICNPAELTRVDIFLEYFSSTNLKVYTSLLSKIGSVKMKNKKLVVNWFYEEDDDDIRELGNYISSQVNIEFNIIEIRE
jgi:hypothetical protein